MINGSIVCYGSPSYLTQTYGGGNEVTVTVDVTKADYLEVAKTIELHLMGMTSLLFQGYAASSQILWQMTYKISPVVTLSRLFDLLGDMQGKGQIDRFDVTRTTLEQVFLGFARFQHEASHLVGPGA
jgi:hypothetical protein